MLDETRIPTFSGAWSLTVFNHSRRPIREDLSVKSQTRTTPSASLKQRGVIDLKRSCPAVSQIYTLSDSTWRAYVLFSTVIDLAKNIVPMVGFVNFSGWEDRYDWIMVVFPTPAYRLLTAVSYQNYLELSLHFLPSI